MSCNKNDWVIENTSTTENCTEEAVSPKFSNSVLQNISFSKNFSNLKNNLNYIALSSQKRIVTVSLLLQETFKHFSQHQNSFLAIVNTENSEHKVLLNIELKKNKFIPSKRRVSK